MKVQEIVYGQVVRILPIPGYEDLYINGLYTCGAGGGIKGSGNIGSYKIDPDVSYFDLRQIGPAEYLADQLLYGRISSGIIIPMDSEVELLGITVDDVFVEARKMNVGRVPDPEITGRSGTSG